MKTMADIEIQRTHGLDWAGAQALAQAWRAQAESDWGMTCTHTPGEGEDQVTFERPGAQGLLRVDAAQFELQVTLGFLLRAYKVQISEKINRNLDEALARLGGA
jgi:putative polyhydroxyalkanoate system protein